MINDRCRYLGEIWRQLEILLVSSFTTLTIDLVSLGLGRIPCRYIVRFTREVSLYSGHVVTLGEPFFQISPSFTSNNMSVETGEYGNKFLSNLRFYEMRSPQLWQMFANAPVRKTISVDHKEQSYRAAFVCYAHNNSQSWYFKKSHDFFQDKAAIFCLFVYNTTACNWLGLFSLVDRNIINQ